MAIRISRQLRKREQEYKEFYHHPGELPGAISIPTDSPPPAIRLIDYNDTDYFEEKNISISDCGKHLDTNSVSWVDIQGLGSADTLNSLGNVFKLHRLVLEDIVNMGERPKIEEYDEQLVIIARMVVPKHDTCGFYSEQVSFVLGRHYLLTLQEEPEHDCFDPVRNRVQRSKGVIRKRGADYLAYALLDSIIDGFFPVLERYGEKIEELEEEVIQNPTNQTLHKIYQVRRELLQLRRSIWPQRDAINTLIRDSSDLISEEVQFHLRDCYDHIVQVIEMVETYRELASGLMDVYMSAVGNKMNEVMKLLTVVSAIFIPLTFIAGIYGMNFNTEKSPYNMPELNWYLGYPLCLGVMATIACILLTIFKKRGWLDSPSSLKKMR